MKKTFYSIVFIASLVFNSCSGNRCDEGYTEVTVNGQDICMPDFLAGEIQDFNKGNDFYHEKYGIISFKNQKWYTFDGKIINDKLLEN